MLFEWRAYLHGATSMPGPWYTQVVVAPLLALGLVGTARTGRAGSALALAIALLFGYVLTLTYVFRLIPLYAGFSGRGSLGGILSLYRTQFGDLTEKLASAALGPAWLIFGLTAAVVALILVQETLVIRRMLRASP